MSLFFVDDSCDFDYQYIGKLSVESFPMAFELNGEKTKLTEDFDYQKFYSKTRKGVVLKEQQLSCDEYIKIFEPALKNGDDIVYVHQSSELFDTKNLLKAKNKLLDKYTDRKFELIDSKNFSIGHGIVSFLLAMQYHNGKTIDEIVDNSYQVKDEIALYMVLDSLEPLLERGLVVDNKSIAGTALNIKPIVAIDIDGKINIIDKVAGKRKAVARLVEIVRQQGENIIDYPIAIASSHSEKDVEFVVGKLKEYYSEEIRILNEHISPFNQCKLGLGAVAIAFHIHKKIH